MGEGGEVRSAGELGNGGLPTLVLYGAVGERDNVPVRESVWPLRTLQDHPAPIRLDYEMYDHLGQTLIDESG